jgi:D-serine deaminase-like pyridoxal phosphate-dependent protein
MSTRTYAGHLDLDLVLDELVDWRFKAFPSGPPIPLRRVPDQKWDALVDFTMPVMVLKQSALDHNLKTFSDFCADRGVSLVPHAKTSMSPQLVAMQLAAGAWGVTAATVSQARVWRAFGAQRIILASEVVDPSAVRWLAQEVGSNPDFEAYCLVDSLAGARLLCDAMRLHGGGQRLRVLVELGLMGGRAGCRTAAEALNVARAVAECDCLRLAGAESFEGIVADSAADEALSRVDTFVVSLRELVKRLDREGLFAGATEVIVTAGGSAFQDRVVAALGGQWDLSVPVEVVLRSGCYLTHDAGRYEHVGPFGQRLRDVPPLRNALEIWGVVLSTPEPGLAILSFGNRDVSYDLGLPMPLLITREAREPWPLPSGACSITRLNDQHAYMSLASDIDIRVGDLVGCGLSHPCTAFDKWRLIPVVDDDYRVVNAVLTYF